MNLRTKAFLRHRFQSYYKGARLVPPPSPERREWGFIFFDELPRVVMRRHQAFHHPTEIEEYIKTWVPAHVYYSAAYYQEPGATVMKNKAWTGADLIFDLDADHLPGKKKSYSEMLYQVKIETLKLLDFLLDDFGFNPKHISIVFSGGRGYHIHVRDPKVLRLESGERREIVDYLAATGLDPAIFFRKSMVTGDFGVKTATSTRLVGFESSWGRRITGWILEYLENIGAMDDKTALSKLQELPGIGEKTSKKILKLAREKNHLEKIRRDGTIEFIKSMPRTLEALETLLKNSIEELKIQLGAQTDEPVTADIKRLIRMPQSLHGGTGMKVTPLQPDNIEKFEPLQDAVVFPSRKIKVQTTRQVTLEMKDKTFELEESEEEVLPEFAAIYLLCRGWGEYLDKA